LRTEIIDQHLGETEQVLQALIFIAENTDDHQQELLRHATVTLSWCAVDKIRQALRHLPRGQL
jgi:hypothetical protein